MTSVHEPVLHALSVEPRAARPSETVCVIFRTRNLGTSASPPGTVAFLLGDGFEALDETEIAVGSVAPGEDVVAAMHARIAAPLDDRTEVAVQAVLTVPDAVLGTNLCAVRVRSRAVLDGAASGTFVEPVDAERVRVRAVVTNEGDGAARDVRVDVPAPAGCVRVDCDEPAVLTLERLEAGASVATAFEARIVEPVAVLQADDGEVWFGDGRRCTLPVREVVVMEPAIAAPCVAVRPSRRSAGVAIDVRNDGWVDAHDVRVRIALPAPLRMVDGGIFVDGVPVAVRGARRGCSDAAFARVERSGGMHVVVMAVPARSAVRVAVAVAFPGGCDGGTIVVGAGAHEVAVPFAPELARDVRMRLIETPRAVTPGGDVRVLAELVNAGDIAEDLFFCMTGAGVVVAPEAMSRTVAPGSVAIVEIAVRAHDTAPDDGRLELSVVACDAECERARAEFAVVVRHRVASGDDEPLAFDAERIPAAVHAALHGPDDVASGAPFAIRLDLDIEDAVEMLAVRVPEVAGAKYVPGSTVLDGRSLLDRKGISPLAGDGLSLRGIAAGTRVTAACTLLADPTVCDEALVVEAVLDVDGRQQSCPPIAVHVRGRDAFAAQPAGLAYHVDACIVESSPPAPVVASSDRFAAAVEVPDALAVPEIVEPPRVELAGVDALTFWLRLDDERLDEVARLLHGAPGGGLVPHVLALRAFFPDGDASGDPGVASALTDVRSALRDVFDRLFVKLRIPGFGVASDDFDDVTLRRAMTGFFDRLLHAPAAGRHPDGTTASITRERAGDLLAAFAGAPYGAPAVLRALAALLPTRCHSDPLLSAALARYACALDDVLASYEGVPMELFDDALARVSDRGLDDARTALLVALRSRAACAEVSC
jgi:hypothetical protein